jgi:hypothetical protein
MDGDTQQVDAAGVMLDGEEDEGIDNHPEQADGHLDEVGVDRAVGMPLPELRPSRTPAVVLVGRWPSMPGQLAADRTLRHGQSALPHLARDARESGETAVVDVQDRLDPLLADPRPTRFLRFVHPVASGLPLLKPFESAEQSIRGNNPGEEIPERPDQPLHRRCMDDTLGGGHPQPSTSEAAFGGGHLLIDGTDEIIDRQAGRGIAQHLEADADTQRQGLDLGHGRWVGQTARQAGSSSDSGNAVFCRSTYPNGSHT